MLLFPATVPPSIGKLAGFLSSGFVGAAIGRFARRSAVRARVATKTATNGDRAENSLMASRAADRVPMSPALLRRVRTGRLSLPRPVAELTPDDEPALAAVNAFADRLAELPMADWLTVGRTLIDNPSLYAHRETPYAILEATIANRGLSVAAWYVRDAIETSAYYASRPMTRWSSKERRAFAAAHAAAEEAALAILARAHLADEDVSSLCAPFAAWTAPATSILDS
jgi:hypothetical protein